MVPLIFPRDSPISDSRLKLYLAEATQQNFNQYAPMPGNSLLIEQIINFNQNRTIPISVKEDQVTVSPGATFAIYTAFATILDRGDEVIVLQPFYDSYIPAIEMNGGIPVLVNLDEKFEPDFEKIKNAITTKTKAIIINSPHNPSGKVWNKQDFDQLATIIENTEIYVISDEVYDLLVYDGAEFYSAIQHPLLRERCFCLYSFGKMFHATGWKVGYVLASAEITAAYRRIHQYLCFSVNSPAQYALAKYFTDFDANENQKIMQAKRDFFLDAISDLPFTFDEKAQAGYFQILRYDNISTLNDKEFAVWLTEKGKVATIPVNAFYSDEKTTHSLRFCFAKKEETILKAVENLKSLWKL